MMLYPNVTRCQWWSHCKTTVGAGGGGSDTTAIVGYLHERAGSRARSWTAGICGRREASRPDSCKGLSWVGWCWARPGCAARHLSGAEWRAGPALPAQTYRTPLCYWALASSCWRLWRAASGRPSTATGIPRIRLQSKEAWGNERQLRTWAVASAATDHISCGCTLWGQNPTIPGHHHCDRVEGTVRCRPLPVMW